jgi:hypothetical protein
MCQAAFVSAFMTITAFHSFYFIEPIARHKLEWEGEESQEQNGT